MTNLEALRLNARLSVEDLAERAGVARQSILDAEREQRKPRVATLGKLADYFGVEPALLLMPFTPPAAAAPAGEAA